MVNWFTVAKLGHHFLSEVIQRGDWAVDGTMGNGHDTLVLANLVGAQGKVFAFDIQELALKNTAKRLADAGIIDQRVTLIQDGHQNIKRYLDHPVKGALFNLGYLPGGDHTLITKTPTTLVAVKETLDLLTASGRMAIVVYPGHPGGLAEREAIEDMASQLNAYQYKVLKVSLLNRPSSAPGVILIEKAGKLV